MVARLVRLRDVTSARWNRLGGLAGDGVLYLASAVFAALLGVVSSQGAQWQWGYLTLGPYALIGVVALLLSRRVRRRVHLARVVLLVAVGVGVVAVPLGLEAHWHHAQPEVGVITRAGQALSKDHTPYRAYDHNGKVVGEIKGLPAFESFFPYFPLMGVFGLPSATTHEENGLTDARIIMTLMTLATSAVALALLRARAEQKLRVAQVLIALPSGALFLSTGGDDMPILALSLLAVAALQRRQVNLAGVALGLAAAMKLTAWPLAAGALLVARDREGRAAWPRIVAWVGVIVLATTLPFAVRNPAAFMANVFAFPLGLAGVTSPAASALPGHVLTTWEPVLGHVLAPATFVVGGVFFARYLRRHQPLSLSQLLGVLAVAFAVVICVASATRIGYVIYPLNLALWSSITRPVRVEEPASLAVAV
ncbi:MAG TPA: glycosyltransferase 87 family protein [Acidimicrobiales bacterium]|nr:glycosyltransferase 87 family protein [Acidimicrobiales bacterium]